MVERRVVAGGAAIALLAVVMVAWVLLSPGWAVRVIGEAAQQQLGRAFSASGGAHLSFSPLAIRIDGPALGGVSETADSLAKAGSMIIPVTFGQLVGRSPDLSAIALKDAEFALIVDERGKASWDFPEATAPHPLRLTLEQASFRYFDARNGQALTLANADGVLEIGTGGDVSFTGSAVINARIARIDASLKSLARVNADGSPLELAITTDVGSANFSGRLSTAKVLSLAGPLSLTAENPAEAARWAGLTLAEDMKLPGPLNLEGALDSAGRAYAIRNTAVTIGQFRGAGDVVADLRGERPKLQADLRAEALWLDVLVPSAGGEQGAWGSRALPLAVLRSFDAEVSILAAAASYGGFTAGPSRLAATLQDGRLDASGAFRLAEGGTASFTTRIDAVVLPPAISLSLKAQDAPMDALAAAWPGSSVLAGNITLDAELQAEGRTQEEMVGTLRGTASLSLAQGRLAGLDVPGLVATVGQRIVDGWGAAPGGTTLTTLEADITLGDGIATLTRATATAGALPVSLTGTVDLLRRALDVKAAFGTPEAAPLPVPVAVRGKWEAPRIYPDLPGILENPEGGYQRLRSAEPPQGN